MAFAATVQWEIDDATGTDTNGGGFDDTSGTPGTDYTYGGGQTVISWAAAGGDYTNDLASTSASGWLVLTSASRNFVAADVGNIINIQSGTNFTAGRYQIMSVSANAATLDRACGSSGDASSGAGRLGGSLKSLTDAATELFVAGNKCWIKAASYSLAANVDPSKDGTQTARITVEGYSSTRGDAPTGTNRPLIACGSYYVRGNDADYWKWSHIRFTANNSNWALEIGNYGVAYNCRADNTSSGVGIRLEGIGARAIYCEATSSTGAAIANIGDHHDGIYGCYLHDSAKGFSSGGNSLAMQIVNCVIDTCTTGIDLSFINVGGHTITGNVIYNGTTGISIGTPTSGPGLVIMNNIISDFTTGISQASAMKSTFADFNAFYNCTTKRTNIDAGDNDIDLSATPFVDAGNGDFNLNTEATGGQLLRDATLTIPGT